MIFPFLFYSCDKKNELIEEEVDNKMFNSVGSILDICVFVTIVDNEYNDRLNPELPSYLGDDFVNGIEVLYPVNGERLKFLDYYRYYGGDSIFILDSIYMKTVQPPVRYWGGHCADRGMYGHYTIDCSNFFGGMPSNKQSLTYIRYPDGSEDEIKVEYWDELPAYCIANKVWVNDELAFHQIDRYLNPKFFPRVKEVTVYDADGNEIKAVMPELGQRLLWIVKSDLRSN